MIIILHLTEAKNGIHNAGKFFYNCVLPWVHNITLTGDSSSYSLSAGEKKNKLSC